MSIHFLTLYFAVAASNLVPNGGFEQGMTGWGSLWTREAGAGSAIADREIVHEGRAAARIEHRGEKDWSFNPNSQYPAQDGELYTLDAWIKIEGQGSAEICVVLYDAQGAVMDWSYASRSAKGAQDWRHLQSKFAIPQGVVKIHPRLIGYGSATVWLDDFQLLPEGRIEDLQKDIPADIPLDNESLTVTLHTRNGALSVKDKRTSQTYDQRPFAQEGVIQAATTTDRLIEWDWLHFPSGLVFKVRLDLDESHPEFVLALSGEGELPNRIAYPHPFANKAGEYLVIPLNEGISYPVDDKTIDPMRLVAYGGHGICMPFWGETDGSAGRMAILQTPDDASINIFRQQEKLGIVPEWEPQKGQFGYPRQILYAFFDKGGHTAICKRYRAYAKETGLLKTLQQKKEENPHVDKLIGAVNVWCWESDPLRYVREMQALGIERILWSDRENPSVIEAMNRMDGVLTSRYDIYQDVMDPAVFPLLNGVHPDWPTEAWPQDLMLDESGDWRKGWEVKGKDGAMHPCGVLCDQQAIPYARSRISEELKTYPYRCRFIDTTTASPWRECYHPDHPMTRSQSRYWKMELLRLVSEEMRLVTGSETGHDAAVPYVHYFEGMLSLGPYRVPDSGRDMLRIWDEVPERVAKFQLGHQYRLPLWELVYHDCVVSQWYWGDYNNKLPSLWDKRDLFNVLYGTPPMFMFNRQGWENNKERFAQSYKNICPIVRDVGYSEMLEHRFLNPDRSVQQTVFANGTVVAVNFGDIPFQWDETTELAPMSFRVEKFDGAKCCDYMMYK
ncbi:MAG: glycoside hydrolase [Candidatus Omnitrophota bacterium]